MQLGRYVLERELGRGGAGVVYLARGPESGAVAVKVLATATVDDALRFERERRLQGALGLDEGFVPLLDAGVERGRPFLVSPFMPGGTLRARLAARSRLDVDEAVGLVRSLSSTMALAHARGIVHRDLKPENVLLDAAGRPFVSDMGLARHFRRDLSGGSQSRSLTHSGSGAGTAGYAPLEQLTDPRAVGPAADVFALGVILYELLAGARPYEEGSAVRLLDRLRRPAPPITAVRPDAPPWLAQVIARALAVEPAERFAEAGALALALAAPARVPRRRRRARPSRPALLLLGAGALTLAALFAVRLGAAPAPPRPDGPGERQPAVSATSTPPPPLPSPVGPSAPLPAPAAPGSATAEREDPGVQRSLQAIGRRRDAGDLAGARALADEALEARPGSALLHGLRAELHDLLGDDAAALRDIEHALRLDPELPQAYLTRSAILAVQGDLAGALQDATRALELDPALVRAYELRAQVLAQRGERAAALDTIERGLALGRSPYLHGLRGSLLARTDPARAVADLTQALTDKPRSTELLFNRGAARLATGDLAAALEDLDLVLELEGGRADAFLTRAQVRRALGDLAGALEDGERAVALDPALAGRQRVATFLAGLRAAAAAPQEAAMDLIVRALDRHDAGDLAGCLALLEEGMSRDPASRTIHLLALRGRLHGDLGDPRGAIADLTEALRVDPGALVARAHRAEQHWRLGHVDAALADVEAVLREAPDHPVAHAVRGLVRHDRGDLDGALADAALAERGAPKLPTAHELRARVLLTRGDLDGALGAFDRAIALLPVARLYGLRAAVHTMRRDLPAALADVDRAVARGGSPEHLLQRAVHRLALGDPAGALADVTRALELGSGDARAYLLRADAHLALGDRARAAADCDRAVELEPSLAADPRTRRIRAGSAGPRD